MFYRRCITSFLYPIAALIVLAAVSVLPAAAQTDPGGQARPRAAQSPATALTQKASPSRFEKDLWHGVFLIGSSKLDEAAEIFRTVLIEAARVGDVYAQAQARRGLGFVLYQKANYPAARAECQEALLLFESIKHAVGQAHTVRLLGNISHLSGDDTAAREYYRRSLRTYDALGMLREQALVMGNLASAGDPESDKLTERELEIARRIGDKKLQASALLDLGDELFFRGEFGAAEDRYDQAAVLYQETADQPHLARVLISEGRLWDAHGHPDKALQLYQQALDLQQQLGDREGALQSINAMAVAYGNLKDYPKAAELRQRALAIAKETGSPVLINFELGNLAADYNNLGKYKEALEILEPLLHLGIEPQLAPYRYLSLSVARFHLGQFRQSLEAASQSIEAARAVKNMDVLPSLLHEKAQAESKLGDQEAALADTQQCLELIEELRKHLVPSDFMKRGFAAVNQDLFGFSIDLLTARNQPGRAFEVAEQGRSRAFLDLLATREIQAAPAGEEQRASLRPAPDQLPAHGIDPSRVQLNPATGIVARGEGSSASELWNQWVKTDAKLRSLASVEPFSLGGLRATARRLNSTVLSYWVSPDATYVWLVDSSGVVHSARVEVSSKRLDRMIRGLWPGGPRAKRGEEAGRQDHAEPQTGQAEGGLQVPTRSGATITLNGGCRNNWRELYRLLIEPVEQWLPSTPGRLLTIEPHGPLLMLPFAGLRNARGQYLIERYTLHYVPAVSLLGFTEAKRRIRQASPSYLLIADPAGTPRGEGGRPLPALSGARREVSTVARLLPASEVRVLEGHQATERQVEQMAGQSTVIHFATHGIIRDDQPFDSYLALGGSGWNLKQDGHFTAQKIYGLNLHADLVFLSACRSGLGQVSGDGMAGLTRAFLYAGTPSVIATLWDVADEPTYQLVGAFYRSWLGGSDKARALRSAQLRLLGELRRGRVKIHTDSGEFKLPETPVFWASFVLQGEP